MNCIGFIEYLPILLESKWVYFENSTRNEVVRVGTSVEDADRLYTDSM